MDNRNTQTETEKMDKITTFSIETAQQIADNLNRMNATAGDGGTFYDVVRPSDVSDSIPWGEFGELRCVRICTADGIVGHI